MANRNLKGDANLKGSLSSPPPELESDPAYLIGLGERLREIRSGMSQEEFAREFGLHVNTLRRYESGERAADPDLLNRITVRYPTLNPIWLLSGQGPRVRPEVLANATPAEQAAYFASASGEERAAFDRIVSAVSKLRPPSQVEQARADYVYIPLYDVKAAAGHGQVVDAEPVIDVLAFRSDWLRQEMNAKPSDVRLLFVAGDSMEPDLRAGDIVMIDIRDTGASFEGYYVLRIDGALLVKQLQRLPGGVLEVSSRNQAYKAFTVKTEELHGDNGFAIIGRVVWACRRV